MFAPGKNTLPFQAPTLKLKSLVSITAKSVPMVFRQLEACCQAIERQGASELRLDRQVFAAQRKVFPLGLK
jgi:hypothetical protein